MQTSFGGPHASDAFRVACAAICVAGVLLVPGRVPAVCVGGMPNNVVEPGECCDDGNGNNTDGCCNDCTVRIGGACVCGGGKRACVQPPTDMVAWYPMDDVSGSEVTGILHSDGNGTAGPGLLGDADGPLPVPGMVGGALTFNGASTFVQVPDAPTLNFGRGDFSIDAWVNIAATAGAGVRPIVDKRDTGGAGGGVRGFELFLFNGRPGVQLADGANSNNTCASSGAACTNYVAAAPSVADGLPHHIAVTVRRSSPATLTLYVDGAAVLTVANPRSGSVDNAGNLLIGASGLAQQFFTGWIDELELFTRALNASEIDGITKAGAAGKCKGLDHFLCYRTQSLPGSPPFSPVAGVRVEDQFGAATVDVASSVTLCTPANKNDEDPSAPAHPDHLRHYLVKRPPGSTFTTALNQKVVNQFGTLFIDVYRPTGLLVPTAKNLTDTPAAPAVPAVDHFLCHAIRPSRGAPKFTPIVNVGIEDQFGARRIDVIKPTRLCAPANKNGEDRSAPTHPDHLLCYEARLSKRVVQPTDGTFLLPQPITAKFGSPIQPIYTNNQFGPDAMAALAVTELCVPSAKNPVDTGGDTGLDCDDGEFCTEDSVVDYAPDPDDLDFDNTEAVCQGGPNDGQPCPPADCGTANPCGVPPYTPPRDKGCKHDWKTGPAFGTWLIDPNPPHANISPCCESSSDCDDGNECTRDVCVASEHRCHFEPLDPQECGTVPIPPVVPEPPISCADDPTEPLLCDVQCTPGLFGEDCPSGQRPLELRGFADIHHHMFDEDAYGARWRYGKASGSLSSCDGSGFWDPHARVATLDPVLNDLLLCPGFNLLFNTLDNATDGLLAAAIRIAGPPAFSELIGASNVKGTDGDTGFHLKRRIPGSGWPRWDVMAHERGHGNALKQAWQTGLRLIVVPLGGFEPFCELLPVSNNFGCNEMDDVDRQIDLAQQFATVNASWMQIALSPQDAINIVANGKLAMVLAIETTNLFGSVFPPCPGGAGCAAAIDAEVQQYYDKGIRSVQLAHELDNGFSGAALFTPLFEVFEFAHNKFGPSCRVDFDCARPRFGFDVEQGSDGVCKNARGVTPEGETLMQSLMARGMLIDIAHLSEKGMLRAYQVAKQNVYYPLFHSHTKFRELEPKFGGNNHNVIEHSVPAWVVQKIRRSGGMVGLRAGYLEERTYTPSGIANSCAGSSRSLAQAYEYGRLGVKVPMALGTDLNSFTQTTRPRFRNLSLPGRPSQNPNGACAAGFKAEGVCQTIAQTQKVGTAFDTLGLGDTGSEADLLTDLQNLGAHVAPLRDNSAEIFIHMWLRAHNSPQRTGPADLANDIDVTGIAQYVPIGTRKQSYPGACILDLKYCPNSEQLGDPCRFDGECVGPLTCGSGPLCGLPEGHCVCTKAGGCPPTQYCKLGIPLLAFDNVCKAKKPNGAFCLHRKECLSNHCKFKLKPGPPGPRCVA